ALSAFATIAAGAALSLRKPRDVAPILGCAAAGLGFYLVTHTMPIWGSPNDSEHQPHSGWLFMFACHTCFLSRVARPSSGRGGRRRYSVATDSASVSATSDMGRCLMSRR